MLRIHPFAALRPQSQLAAKVASVPYDVVSTREAAALAKGNPLSFLHVARAEIDLPDDTDPHAPQVYERAASNFQRLQDEKILNRDKQPCLYLYRLQATLLGKTVTQTGVVGCCHIDDYDRGVIKKHEKTRKDKEDDRTRHILTLRAHAEPVFLLYKSVRQLDALITEGVQADPLYEFTAPDGISHTIWRIENFTPYVQAFSEMEAAYVADGHHRSASAARAGAELRGKNPNHRGDEEYNWFLAVLFPSDQLSILPYNRVVKDLNGLTAGEFLGRVGAIASVEETTIPEPESPGSFGLYVSGKWYRLTLPAEGIDRSKPVSSLDYMLLYDRILHPILGIGDIRTDTRIDFIGGIRGTRELEKRVDSGEFAVAFAMHAATIDQLIAVADAGEIMPPKSTWFEPKLRSGLLIHTFD